MDIVPMKVFDDQYLSLGSFVAKQYVVADWQTEKDFLNRLPFKSSADVSGCVEGVQQAALVTQECFCFFPRHDESDLRDPFVQALELPIEPTNPNLV
jgi:hypothetical protein